jgi:hypothetical protein
MINIVFAFPSLPPLLFWIIIPFSPSHHHEHTPRNFTADIEIAICSNDFDTWYWKHITFNTVDISVYTLYMRSTSNLEISKIYCESFEQDTWYKLSEINCKSVFCRNRCNTVSSKHVESMHSSVIGTFPSYTQLVTRNCLKNIWMDCTDMLSTPDSTCSTIAFISHNWCYWTVTKASFGEMSTFF